MLGLGSSLTTSSTPLGLSLLGTYTSDFSSGVDGWGGFNISEGTQTLTANQSIGGVSAALKVSYDENEEVLFGIAQNTPWSEDFKVGDFISVEYKYYSDDQSPADAANISIFLQAGSSFHSSRRVSDTGVDGAWHTVSVTLQQITGGTNNNSMRIGFSAGSSAPGSGDSWYIKDIVVKHFR